MFTCLLATSQVDSGSSFASTGKKLVVVVVTGPNGGDVDLSKALCEFKHD
jgi:hypothetical protein